MITPIELSSKVFNKSGLGYEKRDVDNFIREVSSSYETLYKENVELKDKINALNDGIQYYKTIEKTIQKALVLAEQTADETKEAARQNAKAIEDQAKVKASMIVEDAKRQLDDIHQKTIRLIEQYDLYKAQYKNLAKAQMELLESESFQIHVANIEAFMKPASNAQFEEDNTKAEETKSTDSSMKQENADKDDLSMLSIENI